MASAYRLIPDEEQDIELILDYPYAPHYTYYNGQYEVFPIFRDEQVLDTDGKVLLQDIIVHPIPITYTDNEFGGVTATIG